MANQYDTNLKLQAIADAIGDTQSSGLIQALEDIADAVAGGGGGGSSAAGLVSDNFSETDTYDMGDYCIHNNTLYVCINAITTPGPWDLSDWQATNAGIQLSSLNSALANRVLTDTVAISAEVPSNYMSATPVSADITWTNYANKRVLGAYIKNANYANWLLWATPVYNESSHVFAIQIRNYFSSPLTATATLVVVYENIS